MGDPEIDPAVAEALERAKAEVAAIKAKAAKDWKERQQAKAEKAKIVPLKPKAKETVEEVRAEFKEAPKEKPKADEAPKSKFDATLEEMVIEAEDDEGDEDDGPRLEDKFSKTIKPTIVITSKVWTHPKFMMVVERSLLHLNDASAGIYQRGNILVRSIEEWGKGVRGERVKVCELVGMTEKNLERKMDAHIRWRKKERVCVNKQDQTYKIVETDCNPVGTKIATYALEMRGDWPFPVVEGVINAPTLRPSRTPLNELGYDRETGLLLINSPEVKINPRPTREDAEAAIDLLRGLFEETMFTNKGALGVALSLIISTVCCGAIPNTPIHIIKAPVGASGKTYVVQIAHVIATGKKSVPMGRTRNGEEFEKRLSTLFIEGRPLVFLDNHNGVLSHDLLCQATTDDSVQIRKFGVLENIDVGTRAVIAATGNGISIASDLNRRTLLAEIDTKLAQPQFKK